MSDSATASRSPQSVSSSTMDYARATASPPVSPPSNQKSHGNDVSNRPRVIIGNSHLTAVDAKHLVPQADITMLKASTIDEAAYCLEHLPFLPDCIVIHEITNDISQGYSSDICANYLLSVVDFCTPGQFLDCFCIFLKNCNTLITSKICFLKVTFQGT